MKEESDLSPWSRIVENHDVDMLRNVLISLGLAAIVAVAYWEAPSCGFVDFDDPAYVTRNPHVSAGLTLEGLAWAFTTGHVANWHPLTWISLMLDAELFGLEPAGYHLDNVILHALNAMLLFAVLGRMTGAAWPSALVAAWFAVHPLHVESVAWVTERKDVLSTFFWLLAMWTYAAYARRGRWAAYLATIILMACGLMAKPMVVTLPCALLLLDYWPLRRSGFDISAQPPRRPTGLLVAEKIPLLLLAALSCIITFWIQSSAGAKANMPLHASAANALVSYVRYIGKMFWPFDLSPYYPFPGIYGQPPWEAWQVWGAVALITAVTLAAALQWRQRPYLIVGWLWYVGTLVPVIGLVQVGTQGMADRYTYIPLIGLFMMVAWGAHEFIGSARTRRPWPAMACSALAAATIITCIVLTQRQVRAWSNSDSYFQHILRLDQDNWVGRFNYATFLQLSNRLPEALEQYERAEQLFAPHADLQFRLGQLKMHAGDLAAARRHFHKALDLDVNHGKARHHLAVTLWRLGDRQQARTELERAVAASPELADEFRRSFELMTQQK